MTLLWEPHLFWFTQTLFLFSHERFFLYIANCIWLIRSFDFGYLVAWFNCPPYSNAPESKNESVMCIYIYWEVNGGNVLKGDVTGIMLLLSPGICNTNRSVKNYLQILQKPADTVSDSMWWLQMNTSCEYFWRNDPGQLNKSAFFYKKVIAICSVMRPRCLDYLC